MESPSFSVQPRDEAEIAAFLAAQSEANEPVVVHGGGSKASLGRPAGDDATVLDLSELAGITLYEPEELVLTARAGTPIGAIAAAVAEHGQCLAFEPPDFTALLGADNARPTLGGVVAAGLSGPRRIKAGAVRDHVLGARAVGGDGKIFKSGGRVVKNVTGFDLPKLLTGSHGTLAVMTEITIKVLPASEASRSLLLFGLDASRAVRAMSEALAMPCEVSGAAHLPEGAAQRSGIAEMQPVGASVTALRIEGFGPSVTERLAALRTRFGATMPMIELSDEVSRRLWLAIRDVSPFFAANSVVWRLSLPPGEAARTVASISRGVSVEAVYDWGGGLVWLSLPLADDAHAILVRGALPSGHATLIRAPVHVRAKVPVFQPQPPALAALTRRVKAAFDPCGILSPGRMYEGV